METYSETHDGYCSEDELEIIGRHHNIKYICELEYVKNNEIIKNLINIGFPSCIASIIEEYIFIDDHIEVGDDIITDPSSMHIACRLNDSHLYIIDIKIINSETGKYLIKNNSLKIERTLRIPTHSFAKYYPISCEESDKYIVRTINRNFFAQ